MTPQHDVAWLTEDEERAWRGWIESTMRIASSIERDLRNDSDLTFDDYELLVSLSEADDRRLRMTELSAQTVQSASRLSQRVDRLTERGFVRREPCAEDRRGLFAVLTDEGFARLAAAAPCHVESVRRNLLDHLTPADLEVLAQLMPRLAAEARSDARPADD